MTNLPLVTVGAINFNNGKYVLETLRSIISQSYSNIELIIVDDCSTDHSVDLIKAWLKENDKDCKLIQHEKNLGVCATCNDVIKHAHGKYITLIATDDIMEPDKIREQVAIFESEGIDTGVIYSDAYLIDEKGNNWGQTYFQLLDINNSLLPSGMIFNQLIEYRNFIPGMSAMIRKECFEKVGLYDESLMYEDADMWLRISKEFKFKPTDYISSRYRKHRSSMMSTVSSRFYESTLRILSKHIGYSKEADVLIKKQIAEHAENYYKANGDSSSQWLLQKLKYDKKLSSLVLFLLSSLKVKYAFFDRIRNQFKFSK